MKRIFALVLFSLFASIFVLAFRDSATAESANHIVISELQITGSSSNDEFIELYNPTSESISLNNWTVYKKTLTSSSPETLIASLSGSISSHGYYLTAHSGYDGSTSADITYSANSISTNNTIILKDSNGNIIDLLGIGTTQTYEGNPAPNPIDDRSIERKALPNSLQIDMANGGSHSLLGNSEDSNNNLNDFVRHISPQFSTPQNSLSNIENSPITLSPTNSPIPTPEPSPTLSPIPSDSPTPIPTNSPTPTDEPTSTPTPTETPSPTLTMTPTLTPSPTPTTSPSPTITISLTLTPTPTQGPKVISNGPLFRCTLEYTPITFFGQIFKFPKIVCVSNK